MDFAFNPQEEQLRQEIRQFLDEELPSDWNWLEDEFADDPQRWEQTNAFKRKLAQKGWLTISWPKEYGGMGMSPVAQAILDEEVVYRRAPGRDVFGVRMLGPTLMLHGTPEQKARLLPPIARAEVQWCQGYSEPGTGSDLASLQTRAEDQGDYFLITGSKMWTSRAHVADAMFLLARTDSQAPRHKGLSFFLVDMHSPGVTVLPIISMAGIHYFNQVFFDRVRVPKENLVGELNRGWYVATTLLDFERGGVEYAASALRLLEELARYIREGGKNRGGPLSRDVGVRNLLAELVIETQVSRLLSYRVAWMQSRGQVPNKEASMAKLFGSELAQRVAAAGMEILGLYGQLWPDSRWTPLEGRVLREYITSFSTTLRGGSSEIQRNIIALRGLGLPRE